MEHTDEGDVGAASVGKTVDEEVAWVDVIDPYSRAVGTPFGNDALDGTTGNDEFFEHACIDFRKCVARGKRSLGEVVEFAVDELVSETADKEADESAEHINCNGSPSAAFEQPVLGDWITVAVVDELGPLIAKGELLEAFTFFSEWFAGEPSFDELIIELQRVCVFLEIRLVVGESLNV